MKLVIVLLDFKAEINANKQASTIAPSWSKQTMSACKHQANCSLTIHKSCKSIQLEFCNISDRIFVEICAWSLGGPGLNLGEHNGGKSMLGMR